MDLLVRLASGQLGSNLIMNFGADRRAEDSSVHCVHWQRRFHLEGFNLRFSEINLVCLVVCQGAGAALLDRIRVLQAATPMPLHSLLFDSKPFLLTVPLGAGSNSLLCAERRKPGSYVKSVYNGTEMLKVDFSRHLNVLPRHACCEHLGTSSFPVALGWHQECCGLRGPFSC